jgi:hypothetical protein
MGARLRPDRAIQVGAAVVFGLGFLGVGIAGFAREDRAERLFEARLASIRAGEIPPDQLTVLRKYVNPGRNGLPHIVFRAPGHPKLDMSVTPDFFNGINIGQTTRGYEFPDGYFIPESQRERTGTGKWFLLGVGVSLAAAAFAVARATARLKNR